MDGTSATNIYEQQIEELQKSISAKTNEADVVSSI